MIIRSMKFNLAFQKPSLYTCFPFISLSNSNESQFSSPFSADCSGSSPSPSSSAVVRLACECKDESGIFPEHSYTSICTSHPNSLTQRSIYVSVIVHTYVT